MDKDSKSKHGSAHPRSRSSSKTSGAEHRMRDRDPRRPPTDAARPPAAHAATARPTTSAAPAPRETAPAHRTPAATVRGEPPGPTALPETPHRVQPHDEPQPAAPGQAPPALTPAKRPTGSPKSDLESDCIVMRRLLKANLLSGDLSRAIARSLNDRRKLLEDDGAQTPEEEVDMQAVSNFAAHTPVATSTYMKRQRTETDLLAATVTAKLQRVATEDPLPQRDPRRRRTSTSTPQVVEMDVTPQHPPTTSDDQRPSTSFADAARAPKKPMASTSSGPSRGPTPPPAGPGPAAAPPKTRYPPLIVETFPNWAYHLRQLKTKLGRAPNARPFGKGIRFTPSEDQEYRIIQRYLTDLEKEENISWFSYSVPQDRSLKVAIRGIPVATEPEELMEELRTLGFEPELIRPIRARKGRPGCIFFGILKRTPDLTPAIYNITELLCMPGVTIEAWRGKKGPAQCHRCQGFRHSSHNCHRKQSCVRCGEEHSAHNCPRPKEEPATCANCGGPHPANHLACPVFRREARNKRAGPVAATTGNTEDPRPKSRPQKQQEDAGAARSAPAHPTSANIRTEANEPTPRGVPLKKRKKRPKSAERRADPTAPPPQPANEGSTNVVETAIQALSDVLLALRAGQDPVEAVLKGMSRLLKLKG